MTMHRGALPPAGQPIWAYWEGLQSPLIQLCLATLRHVWQARVLDWQTFCDLWIHDRDLPLESLYVAHRADFIRAYLLRHYGGTWVDADCIALRPLTPLCNALRRYDLIVYRDPTGSIANSFLMARRRSPTIQRFYHAVCNRLRQHRPLEWLELGSVPLTAAIQARIGRTYVLPSAAIMPICWSQSFRFSEPVADHSEATDQAQVDPRAYCYMLSNHSLPDEVKHATRQQLLDAPTRLGALLRSALRTLAVRHGDAPNYRYWQAAGGTWEAIYARRKKRHPYLHIAEMMLTDHVAHHTPCRVLEWGCGTGRLLGNLYRLPEVEVFGHEQSLTALQAGFAWAPEAWQAEHLTLGAPTAPLPYANAFFDIVITCEALLHTHPDDLLGRLQELLRVCRGHLLHLEVPWQGYSPDHDGCWGHDLGAAYAQLGYACRVLPAGYTRQTPYLVVREAQSLRWTWSEGMLSLYRRLDADLEAGFAEAGIPAQA
jgi:SAM-dependent methyltransferase